jgi:hypothetical protein
MSFRLTLNPINGTAEIDRLVVADVLGAVSEDDLAIVLAQIDLINQRLEEIELAIQNSINNVGRIVWEIVTGTAQAAVANTGYITSNAALTTVTLPATAPVGTIIEVVSGSTGGWRVAQNATQLIRFGNKNSTTGTGGSLNSTHQADSVRLLCITADTTWYVLRSIGNLDIL